MKCSSYYIAPIIEAGDFLLEISLKIKVLEEH